MSTSFFDDKIKPHISDLPDIDLLARQIVEGFIIGWHKSPYHGFSVEFAEHRLYNSGDNLKHVDWKVFGRNDRMFTKKYEEETNLRCYITIDQSDSMLFRGDSRYNKLQMSVVYAAALMELMSRQMDACGLALFDENINLLTRVQTSSHHKRELISHLEKLWTTERRKEQGALTYISQSLHELAERAHKRSLIIVFTDMLDTMQNSESLIDAVHHLKHNKHEVIFFLIGDRQMEWEFALPDQAVELIDLETRQSLKLHPSEYRKMYIDKMSAFRKRWEEQMTELQVDYSEIDISDQPGEILRKYLLKRMKMM